MAETEFGEGGYAWTLALTPSAPLLEIVSSTSLCVCPDEDGNPDYTEYAIYNETESVWLNAAGGREPVETWRTKGEWGTVEALGLSPGTEYTFRAKARNGEGVETAFGPGAALTTFACGEAVLELGVTVVKASSTISAPYFMAGLPASIRLAGKSLNDFGFHVDRITGLDLPRVTPDEEFVPGDHSWQIRDEYFAPKRITLEGHVHGTSPEDLRLRIAYLKSFIATFEGSPWRSRSPVRLERSDLGDRHWNVFYESIGLLETVGKRDLSSSARIRITMKSPMPFALSNEIVRTVFTPSAEGFRLLELGNAPSDAAYVIHGPAENPSFSVGDMMFLCDFSRGLLFTDAENNEQTGIFTPKESEPGAYRTTETGSGILSGSGVTVEFDVKGNPADCSWVTVIEPQWQSTSRVVDAVALEHRADADNFIRLFWDGAEQAWVLRKRAGGIQSDVRSGPQAFTAGTRIALGITHDNTNAGGMKLYINGEQAGVSGDTAVLLSAPEKLTLHAGDGSGSPDAIIDLIAGWSRMLSADEMLRIATDPSSLVNHNTTVSWRGTLKEGDFLTIDSARRTAELFDGTTGARSNALPGLTGEIPVLTPGRRRTASDRTQTVIFARNAAGRMEVRYRRRYL